MRTIPNEIQLGANPVQVLLVPIKKLNSVILRAKGGAVTITTQGSSVGLTMQDGECMSISHDDFRDKDSAELLELWGIDTDSTTPTVEILGLVE